MFSPAILSFSCGDDGIVEFWDNGHEKRKTDYFTRNSEITWVSVSNKWQNHEIFECLKIVIGLCACAC